MIKVLKTKHYGPFFVVFFVLTLLILLNVPTASGRTHEIHILKANIDMSKPSTQSFLNLLMINVSEKKALTVVLEKQEAARLKQQRLEDMYLWPAIERTVWVQNEY